MERELTFTPSDSLYEVLEKSVAEGRFPSMDDAIACAVVQLEVFLRDEEAQADDPELIARLKAAWDESLADNGEPEDADIVFDRLLKRFGDRGRSAA